MLSPLNKGIKYKLTADIILTSEICFLEDKEQDKEHSTSGNNRSHSLFFSVVLEV